MNGALLKNVVEVKSLILAPSTQYSLPILVRRNSRIVGGVFYFEVISGDGDGVTVRPVARALFAKDNYQLLFFGEEKLDGMVEAMCAVQCPAIPTHDPDLMEKAYLLFEQLLPFALCAPEEMDEEKRGLLQQYRELFLQMVDSGMRPLYNHLADEFWGWIGLDREEKPQAGTEQMPRGPAVDLGQIEKLLAERLSQSDRLMEEKTNELLTLFQQRLKTDAHKEALFNNLHKELQGYRNEVYDKSMLSLAMDVIKEGDYLRQQRTAFLDKEDPAEIAETTVKTVDNVLQDFEDMLFRQGIEPYEHPGDEIDVTRQKICKQIATDDSALHKKCAGRVFLGYEREGKVIRPEYVMVYQYAPQAQSPREETAEPV